METKAAYLQVEDGRVFQGFVPSWQNETCSGELVFTTAMTGYVEALSDPSYAGQILLFTYPLIGNYGLPEREYWESENIQVRGLVVSHASLHCSHYLARHTLYDLLRKEKIALMTGVDTRYLTQVLRSEGVMQAVMQTGICQGSEEGVQKTLCPLSPVQDVSIREPKIYRGTTNACEGEERSLKRVLLLDFGLKKNILEELLRFPLEIKRVPFDYDYSEEDYDALVLSNGPGDPALCEKSISILKTALPRKKPIFGICLGAQLLALAAGAKTYKLRYGHRGHNQPCMDLETKKCYISSQNHGYAIEEKSLPKDWKVWFRNLNDQSVEAIKHESLPYSAMQFHPEAAPGPTDTLFFLHKFCKELMYV